MLFCREMLKVIQEGLSGSFVQDGFLFYRRILAMEIRNNRRVILIGKKVCLVAGILSAICGIYWLVRAFF